MRNRILSVTNLSKTLGSALVLDHVNITIDRGDIYGLIGQNGAGKTTLIKIITGNISQTSGAFSFWEKTSKNDINAARMRTGCIIETPSLYPNLTAYEHLKIASVLKGKDSEQKILDTLKLVGLDDTNKKKTSRFSLGMKQRLAIGMALVGEPDFLILDEPMNGLDPIGIVEMRNLLLKLNREKHLTILISSHILAELHKIATKYGIIHKGKIVKECDSKYINTQTENIEDYFIHLIGGDKHA